MMRNRGFGVLFAPGDPGAASLEPAARRRTVKQLTTVVGIVAAVALALFPARAVAAPATVGVAPAESASRVLPAKAAPYGHTYSEWAAVWWQWLLAQPASTNPLLDETGANCAQGQQGPVWFLAGGFGGVTRRCAVPVGHALLIPVVNFFNGRFPDGDESEESLR